MFTQPWPVRKGLSIISCLAFEKAKELKKKVCLVSYFKYESDGIHYNFIVGMNLCKNSTDRTESVQWNKTMQASKKFTLYEGASLGIYVTEKDNNDKYLCYARGPAYRESVQINLKFYTEEENMKNTMSCTCPVNQTTNGTKESGTEGKPNESGKTNCLWWKVAFGIGSAIAFTIFFSRLFHWWECFTTAVHGLCGHQREVNQHHASDNPSCGDVINGEDAEKSRANSTRSTLTEKLAIVDPQVNCNLNDGETISLGIQEGCSFENVLPADTCVNTSL